MTNDIATLIEEVKFNTNNTDDNRFTDEALLRLFNNAQRHIQSIIFTAYPANNIFSDEYVTDLVAGQLGYSLPSDIFAINSINSVMITGHPQPLKNLTVKERRNGIGYYIIGSKIFFMPEGRTSISNGVSIVYTRKLPQLESTKDTSELPDICENFFKLYVERRMEQIDSSADLSTNNIFTAKEEAQLVDLFKDNSLDAKYPPITDLEYFNY